MLKLAAAKKYAATAKGEIDHSRTFRVGGVLRDSHKQRLVGVYGVLFSLYLDKEGGAPLWMEVQNVEADRHGLYSAAVGSTTKGGIDPALFAEQKSLWLGMQVSLSGEAERPRLRITKTPKGLVAERELSSAMADNFRGATPIAAADTADDAQIALPPGAEQAHRAQRLHHLYPPQ